MSTTTSAPVKQTSLEILNSDKWRDVTQFLRDTVRDEFEEGEMVNGPNFNLYDILSATEMGDEKMDTFLNGPKDQYIFWPKDRLTRGIILILWSIQESIHLFISHLG